MKRLNVGLEADLGVGLDVDLGVGLEVKNGHRVIDLLAIVNDLEVEINVITWIDMETQELFLLGAKESTRHMLRMTSLPTLLAFLE